ncbi:hypothetical protein QAD02_004103 [Eretmocerus hayati]|uniref:Uncharacterized protein n=1 Tax=Eretmocerus hayati TaxID=131215 RepID=A0ACC2NPU4_9HYME|nr:hypothetical protein QAD02_004103 [Eretmocerus hayati]
MRFVLKKVELWCHEQQNFVLPLLRLKLCPFLFAVLDYVSMRYHTTTTTNTILLSSVGKKKIRRKNKKYAELLEVTDSSTSNRKAAVQRLNAAQLSILVDQPDISLDELHKIAKKFEMKQEKNFSTSTSRESTIDRIDTASKSDFMNVSNPAASLEELGKISLIETEKDSDEQILEELETSGILDETVLIKSSSLMKSLRSSDDEEKVVLGKKKKSVKRENIIKSKEAKEEILDQEHEAFEAMINKEKRKQFNRTLQGFMNVCVNSDSYKHGLRIFQKFLDQKNVNRGLLHVNNISVVNTVIEKMATDGNMTKLFEILYASKNRNISFNAQTYAYVIYCVGRMQNTKEEKLDILKKIHTEMAKDGISTNDVWTTSVFVLDQRKYVEEMILLHDDKFRPSYPVPDLDYDCRLLKNLDQATATPSSTVHGLLSLNDFKDLVEKQIEMEVHGQVTVRNISQKSLHAHNVLPWRNKLSNLEKNWEKAALQAFKKNLSTLRHREKFLQVDKMLLVPYLSILKPEDYVNILLCEARKLAMGSEMYSHPFNILCRQIGIQVYKAYETRLKQNNGVIEKISEVYLKYCKWFLDRDDKLNERQKWMILEHEANKQGVTLGAEVPTWLNNVHTNIGKFIFDIMLNDLKLHTSILHKKKTHDVHGHLVPAFFKIFRHSGVLLREEVKPHPLLATLYRNSQPETLTFDTTLVPSLCPPRPWVSIHQGGYIVTKTELVRVAHMGNSQWDRLAESPPNKLYPALDSLNQLGSIPWSINNSVLDIAVEVFQNDGSVELNMPQPPTILPPVPSAPKDADPATKAKVQKERMELKKKKNEMYSLWCDALYRLSLANHFRNRTFWLPHNMDFRGRVYPVPPHLNHLGSDLARSLLVFALKKPLGPKGLDWLKLHAINLTGFKKKEPISERLKYADEIMDEIIDSAENPLTGRMWWSKSDEPWQTLAACMEINAAIKSPDPENFMSGFPIHQDGSCNGLQHYAALGRDQIGAESVNLFPSDRPQDVYSSVAAMVDEKRKADADQGNQLAQVLEGFVKRKVIKQTVMTTVYGVTWFGAKLQIARQLKDIDDFPQEYLWPASSYLVQKTFQTLRTMFKSAREIQDWFTDCARLVCGTCGHNMEWMTPLGLPVVQPYSKIPRKHNNKNLFMFFSPDIYKKPNVMKQKNAFAPNYVHSLDSSHMMLTSIHSEHAGITFVSVHDCYWTHPCTVEIMNKAITLFYLCFSEGLLESKEDKKAQSVLLKNELLSTLSSVPKQGDFNLNGVLSSTYFFS